MRMFKLNRSNIGFTLIELLVVIAIIGTLATIVTVSTNKSRDKSRDALRFSDMKAIESAVELYAESNNGTTPPIVQADEWADFVGMIDDYMKSAAVPNDPRHDDGRGYTYCRQAGSYNYLLAAALEVEQDISRDIDTVTGYLAADCVSSAGTDAVPNCSDDAADGNGEVAGVDATAFCLGYPNP